MFSFMNEILSNSMYLIITICLLGIVAFFIIKKMTKLIIYSSILLIAFLAYIHYTGDSVTSTVEPVQKALEKAKQAVK
jgi:hypothetical protein